MNGKNENNNAKSTFNQITSCLNAHKSCEKTQSIFAYAKINKS